MESGTRPWIGRSSVWSLPLALAAAASCAAVLAQAEATAQLDPSGLPAKVEQPVRLEISTSTLPRLDGLESPRQRVDLTLLPPRRSALGVAVGMSGPSFHPAAPVGAGLAPTAPPAMDLGLHWRHNLQGDQRIDITAWRRMTQASDVRALLPDPPTYGARVELRLGGQNKSGLVADKGFLGFQLESGARISIKRKNGGPMIYYRRKF